MDFFFYQKECIYYSFYSFSLLLRFQLQCQLYILYTIVHTILYSTCLIWNRCLRASSHSQLISFKRISISNIFKQHIPQNYYNFKKLNTYFVQRSIITIFFFFFFMYSWSSNTGQKSRNFIFKIFLLQYCCTAADCFPCEKITNGTQPQKLFQLNPDCD